MTHKSISDSIPHRGPMLLVDETIEMTETEIVCRKTFRSDEFFFQGHYPDNPLVPGVILCECAAQTAAVLLSNFHVQSDDATERVPVLTRMNKVRFKNTVHPGDTIDIKVKMVESVSGAFFLSATIRKEGKMAVSLELACTLAPKSVAANDSVDGNRSEPGGKTEPARETPVVAQELPPPKYMKTSTSGENVADDKS